MPRLRATSSEAHPQTSACALTQTAHQSLFLNSRAGSALVLLALVEINVPDGRLEELVSGFFERFFKLPLQQLRFGLFILRALPEKRLASSGLLLEKHARAVEVWSFAVLGK